jgi:acyl carrier protein phosphodiesterase
VNFFGHAVVARWHSDEPRFVFGTMLPDFSAMLGLPAARVRHDEVREVREVREVHRGVDYHHATDAAFHGCEQFTRLCGQSIERLTADGVERGTARAVSHVGVELLLDGALSEDPGAVATYRSVLVRALEADLADELAWTWTPEQTLRLRQGLSRLAVAPLPEGYRDPAFVVDRLQAILARRPRLAIKPADQPRVAAYMGELHHEISGVWPELLAQVRCRLGPLLS